MQAVWYVNDIVEVSQENNNDCCHHFYTLHSVSANASLSYQKMEFYVTELLFVETT